MAHIGLIQIFGEAELFATPKPAPMTHWKEPACCPGAAGEDREDQQFDMTLESMHVPRTNPPAKPRQAGTRGTAEGAVQMSLHMERLAALR